MSEPQLRPSGRKRPGLFFWWMMILLLTLVLGAYLLIAGLSSGAQPLTGFWPSLRAL